MASDALSSWVLPESAPLRRAPPRPFALRQPGYDAAFDARTLVYDLFRRPDGPGALAIGPPPLNLQQHLAGAQSATRGEARSLSILHRDRVAEFWIAVADADTAVAIGGGALAWMTLRIQPNHAGEFAGRRVLMTLSRNNELAWIEDWARFHHRAHGADAILFYDNASDRYVAAEIRATLAAAAPGAFVRVVNWPFPFGPTGSKDGKVWDSDFCKYGMFQHARWRYLAHARSVLNLDIDELVVSPARESIFAAAEASVQGYVAFAGCWIAYTPPGATRRHAAFTLRDLARGSPETKWCVVPARCGIEQQWRVHDITGFALDGVAEDRFAYRHFWALSTSWKHDRSCAVNVDPARHTVDDLLARQMTEYLGD